MIESARSKYLLVILLIVFIAAVGVYVGIAITQRPTVEDQLAKQLGQEKPVGRIGQGYFKFEVADTTEERTKGLSGRSKLPDTDAILFVFDSPNKECFWMKDMKFNIDILWFDANKKLIYEKRNVAPSTYPEKFCPDMPSKYVVEVTAGVAAKNQIHIGDALDIEL